MTASPSPRGLFVTGTDTGVGKTWVCRLLVETLGRSGQVTYFKPVQTGCPAGEVPPDLAEVRRGGVARLLDASDHVPYIFPDACSPHLAARRAGTEISLDVIEGRFRRLAAATSALVVAEGAGGVLVPVNDRETVLDVMKRLGLPVVVVTSPRLGTLNHTFLTTDAIRNAGLRLAGVVVDNTAGLPRDYIYKDNIATIRKGTHPIPVLDLGHRTADPLSVEEFCRAITR